MELSPFSDSDDEADEPFHGYDQYVPAELPAPGPFLEGHDVLAGADHVAVHETARDLFEERGVYDITFGYNLARLNLDGRYPEAGYRYARDADDPAVLRAEFTPTTEFCPQSDTLAKGSFRAWNGLADDHGFDLVRVRVHPSHQESNVINRALARLESAYEDTGEVGHDPGHGVGGDAKNANGADGPATPF
jgi:hypothetical protein